VKKADNSANFAACGFINRRAHHNSLPTMEIFLLSCLRHCQLPSPNWSSPGDSLPIIHYWQQLAHDGNSSPWLAKSELLYNWRFMANQLILAPSSLRLMTRVFLGEGNEPPLFHRAYVTCSLTRGLVCLLGIGLVFVKCMYCTHS
jgi:hypothetical protein